MDLQKLSTAIEVAIDVGCETLYQSDKPRQHLGASIIGEDCARKVWYSFRWAKHGLFSGRQLRLFNTGHKEEIRFLEWFRAIGFEVFDFDPSNNEQFRITAVGGHFGGSLDGGAILKTLDKVPYDLTETLAFLLNKPVLLEFKTHNKRNFAKFKAKDGSRKSVQISFPKHHVQMSTYGTFYGLEYYIYAAYCKDDDSIHIEVGKPDPALCADMVRKATEVVTTRKPPPRLAENPTYHECTICSYKAICHENAVMEKNCRTCRHGVAQENKVWFCYRWNAPIPDDVIPQGCGQWAQLDN